MKNRYCSFFLFLLFVDSGIVILRNLLNLAGADLSQAIMVNIIEGSISTLYLFLAIAQVIIAFRHKLKWAAKLIGLYPLFFSLLAMIIGLGSLMTGKPHIDIANAHQFAVGLSIYLLLIGLGQLSVGIWAAKKLASGHYVVAPVDNQISIRND